ncbi:MAG: hypothetical protein K0R16_2046 [Nitrososphaeraceae archaeon]|nr:hypothetical protein [Nitrososphaeraceae archaeon]
MQEEREDEIMEKAIEHVMKEQIYIYIYIYKQTLCLQNLEKIRYYI